LTVLFPQEYLIRLLCDLLPPQLAPNRRHKSPIENSPRHWDAELLYEGSASRRLCGFVLGAWWWRGGVDDGRAGL